MATKNETFSKYSDKYLIIFAQEHVNFHIQELQSICSIFGISVDEKDILHYNSKNPFLIVRLRDDCAAKLIASRSILIRSILKLFASAESLEVLIETLKQYNSNDIISSDRKDDSFRFNVESFNRKLSQQKKLQLIEDLSFLPLEGDVSLTDPGTTFSLELDYSDTETENPSRFFFGRLVANGQRHLLKHYSLKTRHFIGNTSMDPQLSLLMANMAKCKDGMLVYDPFVGTGSILVACSHFGAYSIGSDIDRTLLLGRGHPSRAYAVGKWRGKDEGIRSNFKIYNLQERYVDVWMGDQINTALRKRPMFDAIVTDPPYGIREGSKKSAVSKQMETEGNRGTKRTALHGVMNCDLSNTLYSLLEFSVRHLVLNGRLVYWLPTFRPTYCVELIPSHPCLKLLCNREQLLSPNISRRLITMEKTKEFVEGELNSVDDSLRDVYDRFRKNYFNLENNADVT